MDGPITWDESVWVRPAQIRANLGRITKFRLLGGVESGEIRTIRTPKGWLRYRKTDVIEWLEREPERRIAKLRKTANTWDRKREAGDLAAQKKSRVDLGPPEECSRPVYTGGLCRQHFHQQYDERRQETLRLRRMAKMEHSASGTGVGP